MSVLSAQAIKAIRIKLDDSSIVGIIEPFVSRRVHEDTGTTYGLSACGYDVRLDQDIVLGPNAASDSFSLASTIEQFTLPPHVVGFVHDKSSWARKGIAVQNTVIEPGWRGYLTLELSNNSGNIIRLRRGTPIAQIIFHYLDASTDMPYDGRYQNQKRGPQESMVK